MHSEGYSEGEQFRLTYLPVKTIEDTVIGCLVVYILCHQFRSVSYLGITKKRLEITTFRTRPILMFLKKNPLWKLCYVYEISKYYIRMSGER